MIGGNPGLGGMAAAAVSPELRKRAIFMGMALAAGLLIFFATMIMKVMSKYTWLRWLGRLFLIYLAVDMLHDGWPEVAVLAGTAGT